MNYSNRKASFILIYHAASLRLPLPAGLLTASLLSGCGGGDTDGRPFSAEEYSAWTDQWTDWGAGWVSMGSSYDTVTGGPANHGILDTQWVSPGLEAANLLRQCAGE